jgi:putative ABC transport system substrate-binding protein
VARYIDNIFKGAKPADLPVEELSTTVLAVNCKRARELGFKVSPSIAVRTDHQVE